VEFEFATCHALHNMLVNVDGLSRAWKDGVLFPLGDESWQV
jgi:hypothetical protein